MLDHSLKDMFSAVITGRANDIIGHIEAYHLGYYERLKNAIKSDYPASFEMLKDDRYIQQYITHNPAKSWDLNIYSHNFWEIIEEENIRELARLEAMIHIVFWLPDSEELKAADLANIAEEEFANLLFLPRKALKIFANGYLVNEYLSDFRSGNGGLSLKKGVEYILLVRHENEVKRHILQGDEYLLLQKLFSGVRIGEALADDAGIMPKIGDYLQKWLINGFFAKISIF
jgi:hypothetical protein